MTQQDVYETQKRIAGKITKLLPVNWGGERFDSLIQSVSMAMAEEMATLEARLMAEAQAKAEQLTGMDIGQAHVDVEAEATDKAQGGSVSVTVPIPGT
jgi:hypothetical protein